MNHLQMGISQYIWSFGSIKYDLLARTYLMGILNVTPDSFSDGGKYFKLEDAYKHGMRMVEEGADFIDVGGESTRPGSERISVDEELRRVIPLIEKLIKNVSIPISIDTYKSKVAYEALNAGAVIVNDISGLHYDPQMAEVVSNHGASIILMHIKGTPATMQNNPEYENLFDEIFSYLEEGIGKAKVKNINQIFIDPGIGFGKTVEHNLFIIRNLKEFKKFGYPILVGPSKKSFIGSILNLPIDERLEGTAAAIAVSVMNGANIVRIHDVKEMKRVVSIVDAIIH